MKELHSCEQVQSWAKLRMMDWALSGLQLVLGVISGVEGMQNTQLWPVKHLCWSMWEIYLGENGKVTAELKTRDDYRQEEKKNPQPRCFRLHEHNLVSRKKRDATTFVCLASSLAHRSER